MLDWIYSTNDDNSARYTLGVKGSRVLAFIGINPSIAHPNELDPTVKELEDFVLIMVMMVGLC